MQAWANLRNIDIALINSVNQPNRKFPPISGQPLVKTDAFMSDQFSIKIDPPIIDFLLADNTVNGNNSQPITSKLPSMVAEW